MSKIAVFLVLLSLVIAGCSKGPESGGKPAVKMEIPKGPAGAPPIKSTPKE